MVAAQSVDSNIHAKSDGHHSRMHSGTPLPVLGLLRGLPPQAIKTNQVDAYHTSEDNRPHKEEPIDLTLSSPIRLDHEPKTAKRQQLLSSDSEVEIVTSRPARKPHKTSRLQSSSPDFRIISPPPKPILTKPKYSPLAHDIINITSSPEAPRAKKPAWAKFRKPALG